VTRPIITFLTDFGPSAPAVCRGVIYGIAPEATIIDINHNIPRYSIREGANALVFALPWMPIGTHVAVVDPGVGTERLPLAIKAARGDVLIGPDNGLLVPAAEKLGGIAEVRAITNRELMLPTISSSFHGRDIFSPVAAHLATGTPYEAVGPTVAPDELVRLEFPRAEIREGTLETAVTHVLVFGNVTLAGVPADLEAAVGPLRPGRALVIEFAALDGRPAIREETTWAQTFGRVPIGASLLMEDSEGNLEFADNQGDAAARLGLSVDRPARITAA
jgi:S-adenosyl-L-methionine hydrolase (adenosine-forming)